MRTPLVSLPIVTAFLSMAFACAHELPSTEARFISGRKIVLGESNRGRDVRTARKIQVGNKTGLCEEPCSDDYERVRIYVYPNLLLQMNLDSDGTPDMDSAWLSFYEWGVSDRIDGGVFPGNDVIGRLYMGALDDDLRPHGFGTYEYRDGRKNKAVAGRFEHGKLIGQGQPAQTMLQKAMDRNQAAYERLPQEAKDEIRATMIKNRERKAEQARVRLYGKDAATPKPPAPEAHTELLDGLRIALGRAGIPAPNWEEIGSAKNVVDRTLSVDVTQPMVVAAVSRDGAFRQVCVTPKLIVAPSVTELPPDWTDKMLGRGGEKVNLSGREIMGPKVCANAETKGGGLRLATMRVSGSGMGADRGELLFVTGGVNVDVVVFAEKELDSVFGR